MSVQTSFNPKAKQCQTFWETAPLTAPLTAPFTAPLTGLQGMKTGGKPSPLFPGY